MTNLIRERKYGAVELMRTHFQSLNWWLSNLWGKHSIVFFAMWSRVTCTHMCVHNWRHLAQWTIPSYQSIHENCIYEIHYVVSFCIYSLGISFHLKKYNGFNFFLLLEFLQFDLVRIIDSFHVFLSFIFFKLNRFCGFDNFWDLILMQHIIINRWWIIWTL